MKIKIIRCLNPLSTYGAGHVYLLAWSESKQDLALLMGENVSRIRFDYSNDLRVAVQEANPDEINTIVDEDSVLFESNQSFEFFVNQLLKSKFRTGRSYDLYDHNCIDSIIYALNIAGIEFNVDREKYEGVKHLLLCCWCPTSIITPRDLIESLKERSALIEQKDEGKATKHQLSLSKYPPFARNKSKYG